MTAVYTFHPRNDGNALCHLVITLLTDVSLYCEAMKDSHAYIFSIVMNNDLYNHFIMPLFNTVLLSCQLFAIFHLLRNTMTHYSWAWILYAPAKNNILHIGHNALRGVAIKVTVNLQERRGVSNHHCFFNGMFILTTKKQYDTSAPLALRKRNPPADQWIS